MSEVNEPEEVLGKTKDGYDCYYYTVEVKDEELTPRIKSLNEQISKLTSEKDKLVKELLAKTPNPRNWSVSLNRIFDYGYIEAKVTKRVWKESKPEPVKPVYTPPTQTPLEKMLNRIDAKTLFNSGILTREEKRELLGLPNEEKTNA